MTKSSGKPNIYGLYDREGNLRYIGKANVPTERLKSHMRDSRKRNTPLYAWIRKHGAPEMRVIEAECDDWREAERRLIKEARDKGIKLLNLADGGEEPYCPPEIRSANGHRLVAKGRDDPKYAAIKRIKTQLGTAYYRGWCSDSLVDKMRAMAVQAPDIFGKWKDLPYKSAV